jgi:hypothetical protein
MTSYTVDYGINIDIYFMRECINNLNPIHKSVINMRLNGNTYKEIGKSLSISNSRASQIYNSAKEKLTLMFNGGQKEHAVTYVRQKEHAVTYVRKDVYIVCLCMLNAMRHQYTCDWKENQILYNLSKRKRRKAVDIMIKSRDNTHPYVMFNASEADRIDAIRYHIQKRIDSFRKLRSSDDDILLWVSK